VRRASDSSHSLGMGNSPTASPSAPRPLQEQKNRHGERTVLSDVKNLSVVGCTACRTEFVRKCRTRAWGCEGLRAHRCPIRVRISRSPEGTARSNPDFETVFLKHGRTAHVLISASWARKSRYRRVEVSKIRRSVVVARKNFTAKVKLPAVGEVTGEPGYPVWS